MDRYIAAIVLAGLLLANCSNNTQPPAGGTTGTDATPIGDLAGEAGGSDEATPVDADAGMTDAAPVDGAEFEVAPADTQPPTIAIKNLFNGSKISGAVTVEVEAKDDQVVASVQYFLNGTPVETATTSPFSWKWDTTAFASGNWFLSAVATDGAGKTSEPAEVEVTVSNKGADCGEAPQVKLVYPTDKAVVCGDLDIQTAASGPCGLAKVEFFIDDKKIGEASQPPYKTAWKTQGLKDGQHFVKAVATDVAKQASQQTIVVNVDNKQTQCVNPPTVFLAKPGDNSYVFGKVAIEAEASAGGDVAATVEVLFSVDGSSIGKASASPWTVSWDSDAKAEGPHTLKAIAKDNFDKLGVHQITLTVDRTDPTVKFVAPEEYANVNGDATPVTVAAEAADNLALGSVSFAVVAKGVSGAKDLGTVKTKPWQVKWATDGASSGDWTLTATATDAAGHSGKTTRTVTLDRPPTIDWSKAWQTSKPLAGKVTLSGIAEDDLGMSGAVKVTIDGQPVSVSGDGNKYKQFTYEWDTALAAYGEHELVAEVEDSGGHKAKAVLKVQTDQPLAMSVDVCAADWQGCKAPAVDPSTEYTGKVYLQVQAKDDNADVKKVELQVDGATVQTLSAAPWQFTWDSAGVKDGPHELGLKVTTSLPESKSVAFGLTVNNCDLDHDKHLAQGVACGGDDCNDAAAKVYAGALDAVGNGTDDNCDGMDGVDADGDKVASLASGGKDCDDGNKAVHPCADELAGSAVDSNCDGKLAPSCDDCLACSTDSLQGGKCLHSPVSEGAGCDDGSACTSGEVCKAGACGAGAVKDCQDGNACTGDSCDLGTGFCVNEALAVGASCDDGDLCTLGDACGAGGCKGVAKACAGIEVCKAGACVAGAPSGMVLIPAGKFLMGCVPGDSDCYGDDKPQHEVDLPGYYMDVYEVTVAAYKGCVDAGKCTAPKTGSYLNWGKSDKKQHPVNGVNWYDADGYCNWAGSRLPTEAEWEKASRGGLAGKKFPWGDADPTCTPGQASTAVFSNGAYGCGPGSTWNVGTGSSKNGYGLYDMSGNVWEWVNDWYGSSYYSSSPSTNPQGPASGSGRVRRGGSFITDDPANLRSSVRSDDSPPAGGAVLGFRCARSLP